MASGLGRRTTLDAIWRKHRLGPTKCTTCHKPPWGCKCRRTALDLLEWLQRTAEDLMKAERDGDGCDNAD